MASDYRNSTIPGLTRGIRNNNPGNIKAKDSWQGMVGQDAGGFIIFSDMSWGTRAIGQSLINMINKGTATIATLIPEWSATDQAAYITNVSSDIGIDQDAQLGTDPTTIAGLIRAISNQENGDQLSYQYVLDSDIQEGISKINSGLLTAIQAVAIDAGNNPWPYTLGAIVVITAVWYFTKRRRS